ncbi:MAG: BrnT family toxin [Verrucomicrobiota bacterium]
MPLTFEWDSRKARGNLAKHGVTFEEAATVFADSLSFTISDPEHSTTEQRQITLGRAFNGKMLVVVHTDRGDNIRIISARRASRQERRFYEEEIN